MDKAKLNRRIKDFSLIDQHSATVSSKDLLKHKYAVIYFYAKDDTSG